MEIKQYQVVLANLDTTLGSEIKKTHPCLVISPNEMNKNLQTLVVAPMTTKLKPYPTWVEIKHLNTQGWAALDQIKTIDKQRIVKVYDFLTKDEIENVKSVIRETFVD